MSDLQIGCYLSEVNRWPGNTPFPKGGLTGESCVLPCIKLSKVANLGPLFTVGQVNLDFELREDKQINCIGGRGALTYTIHSLGSVVLFCVPNLNTKWQPLYH